MRKLLDRRGITLTEMLCTVLIVLLHPYQRYQRQAALLRHRDAG